MIENLEQRTTLNVTVNTSKENQIHIREVIDNTFNLVHDFNRVVFRFIVPNDVTENDMFQKQKPEDFQDAVVVN